ncbi:hypothetical protein GOFOIKOB_1435 [Methylobacterium tardum]|uniref:Uncharacterized protein n=1 Tax=Methylobacterium tardum TaxID=374432 RepID=A0AA37WV53_9HYPH|nr:hypothetical protein [Methylobacterium tardum]GJE48406.1 hypothetical protein GOFOIKOB_1435 [Methylobacterium tardum]GLS73017.1 hypothetical protein GCM10007890_50320 [Methylobacterium tardum]
MRIEMQFKGGAFKMERSGDIKDLSILASLGYREALSWAISHENTEIVLGGLTVQGNPHENEYIEIALLGRYCTEVWGQGLPNDPEFCLGFYVGLDEAVKRLSIQSGT